MPSFQLESVECEYRSNLLGTDIRKPRFGWKLASDRRGTYQQAYRIQVAVDESFEAPVWDTGRMESGKSIQVEYGGPEPLSRTCYYFRVKAWDNFGRESEWSEPAWWETGLLSTDEWKAQWITPDPDALDPDAAPVFMLRKPFAVKSGLRRARIYATAAGVYELHVNGDKIGDELLAPGWTSYLHRQQYQTYDVTTELQSGTNAIGVLLGDGWYKGEITWMEKRNRYGNRRALLLQLHLEYEDGSEELVMTDPTWKAATGPILLSEIYAGEIYDARLEKAGWSGAAYDDSDWSGTIPVALPVTQLVAQENWPIRVTETIRPQAVIRTPSGETVLDMGQNMVGRVRLNVNAPEGTLIRLQHAEVLDKEGNFYTRNLRKAKQTIEYISSGRTADYAPHFTFQGFRYVKVEGLEHDDDNTLLGRFTGEVIHSDMKPAGHFECSHPMVNRLQRNIVWGQRGNFLDVPTDCPQRDERLGWTGDAQVFIRTAAFNYHVGPFFTKWLRDLKADQRPSGSVPFVIPDVLMGLISPEWGGETHTSSAWGDAATVCPWTVYLCYGDDRLLSEQYGSMKGWVEYIRSQGENEYLWNSGFHFGDWLALDAYEGSYYGATPVDLISTAYYALSTKILRDSAAVLGKEEDVVQYSGLLDRVIAAFRENYMTPAGQMTAKTQTAHVLALMFELVEGSERERVAQDLNELVVQNGYRLSTGFVGTPYLCYALSDNGYHETAVKLLLQESYPSWLYSITKGATTIWEHWDGIKPDGSFWSDDMNSYNHYAYGAIGDWMYRRLAGLDMEETEPAYKRIRIRPRLQSSDITWVRASIDSPYGQIVSGWSAAGGERKVEAVIPVNTTAEILLPGASFAEVKENGRPLHAAEGVRIAEPSGNDVRIVAGSGSYCFTY